MGFPELDNKACCGVGFTVGSVLSHPDFVTDPHKAAFDVWESKDYNLAANGAVMRTSVLGLPMFFDESKVVQNAINAAKVTHSDPRCIFSSVVVSVLISRMLTTDLGIQRKSINMDDGEKERLQNFVERKTTGFNDTSESVYTPKVFKPQTFMQSMSSRILRIFGKTEVSISFPKHKDVDPLRRTNPVECSNDPNKFSTSLCGQNDQLNALVEEVLSDYKFLIHTEHEKSEWNTDIDRLCRSKHLHEIELDERSSIGYTVKCLASALFCLSREKCHEVEDGEFFAKVITELVLEAGDADTNAVVAGGLLGCRFGYQGLPKAWLDGIRHKSFLLKACDELLDIIWKQLLTQN